VTAILSLVEDPNGPALVEIGTDGMTVDQVHAVAVDGAELAFTPAVGEVLARGRDIVQRVLDSGRMVYGLNTQLGHGRNTPVPYEQLLEWQVLMVDAHAGGVGPALPAADVRAQMVARLAGAAQGGSGLHPHTFDVLLQMVNRGVTPVVPAIGSVGASDLSHCAAIAQVAIGRGWADYDGQRLPGATALHRAGIEPAELRPKEGLAMVSANVTSIGVGALVVHEAAELAALAEEVMALTLEVLQCNLSPFESVAVRAKPLAGQIAVAANIRALLADSYLHDPATKLSVQDPLSLRTFPQVHGAFRDQIEAARHAVTVELNAMDDNPLVAMDEDRMLSTGNFHPLGLAVQFEALRVTIGHVGLICDRRVHKVSHHFMDLARAKRARGEPIEPFGPGLLGYSGAAILAEIIHLANPVTMNCPPLDLDVEDHATLAPLTVDMTRRALGLLRQLVCIELLSAVKASQVIEPVALSSHSRRLIEWATYTVTSAGTGASGAEMLHALVEATPSRPAI
jgi:histidine ammonia-lyase